MRYGSHSQLLDNPELGAPDVLFYALNAYLDQHVTVEIEEYRNSLN